MDANNNNPSTSYDMCLVAVSSSISKDELMNTVANNLVLPTDCRFYRLVDQKDVSRKTGKPFPRAFKPRDKDNGFLSIFNARTYHDNPEKFRTALQASHRKVAWIDRSLLFRIPLQTGSEDLLIVALEGGAAGHAGIAFPTFFLGGSIGPLQYLIPQLQNGLALRSVIIL